MHADVAGQAFELLRERQQLARFLVRFLTLLQPRLHLARVFQRDELARLERDQLGELVGAAVVPFHDPAHVAHHRLRRHGAEGHDLRHRLLAVLVADVLDHAVAAVLAEIHVEVRHGHPLGVEEAFEQQVVAQRIEVGDAQRIRDQRARAGTAARPHRHAVRLGPVDEIGDDEKVTREAHLHDGLDLELEALAVARHVLGARGGLGVERLHAQLQAGDRALVQILLETGPLRSGKQRQPRLAEIEREIAAARNLHGIIQRLRQVGEEFRHLGLGLEVLLFGEVARAALVGKDITRGNAHARLVGGEILALEKLHRMRRHHRQFQAGSKSNRPFEVVLGMAGALQLDIEALRKKLRPSPCQLLRLLRVIGKQRVADIAEMRARQRNQSFGAGLAEPLLLDFGAATVLIVAVGARQPVAQAQVAPRRGAQQQGPEWLVAVGFV